jgi:hypothetical protein
MGFYLSILSLRSSRLNQAMKLANISVNFVEIFLPQRTHSSQLNILVNKYRFAELFFFL